MAVGGIIIFATQHHKVVGTRLVLELFEENRID
jgi:hypothetical protein